MMYRKNRMLLLWFVTAMTLMSSCTSRYRANYPDFTSSLSMGDTIVSSDTLNSEMRYALEREIVLNQVKGIYNMVKADYMAHGGARETELFDRAFCSKAWNKLLLSVRCKEERSNTLFFEINHWSMMHYSGAIVSFDEFEVTSLVMEPQRKASVSFTVADADTYTPARIDLVYENDRWVIDNFYNLRYMLDVRNCMWQYLANDYKYM